MGNITHGMNIDTVRRIGRALRTESSKLRGVMQEIDRLVGSTGSSWKGPDRDQFANEWNGVMRARVSQIVQQLLDLSEKARTNADAQDKTSTEFDGGYAGGGGYVGGGGGGSGGGAFDHVDDGPPKLEGTDKLERKGERHRWKWEGREHAWGAELPESDDSDKKPGWKQKTELKIAGVSTGDSLAKWDQTWGGEHASATAKADVLFYDAKAGVSARDGQFSGAAGIEAGLARAGVDGKAEWGILEAKGKGEVYAGGKADIEAGIGKSGLNLQAEAFAGARATIEGSAGVGGVGVTGGAEGWAGFGGTAKAQLGMVDGKFGFKLELGAAIGIGGKVSVGFQVDVPKLVNTVKDGARAVGDFISDLWPF